MMPRSTIVAQAGTIGRLQRTIAAAPTACTSTAHTSAQVRAATAASTLGGQSGASCLLALKLGLGSFPSELLTGVDCSLG